MNPSELPTAPVLNDGEAPAQRPDVGVWPQHALLDGLPLAVFEFQPEGVSLRLSAANAAARRIAGLADAIPANASAAEVLAPLAPQSFIAQLLPAARTGASVQVCLHGVPTGQGAVQTWELSAYGTAGPAVAVVVRDASETVALAEARRELHEQESIFNAMESMARVGHWRRRTDDPLDTPACSAGLYDITGLDPQDMVSIVRGRSHILEEDLPAFLAMREGKGAREVEYRFRRPDGEVRWLRANLCRSSDQDGRPLELGVVLDVTEQRNLADRLQEQLDFIQRVASRVPGVIYLYRFHADGTVSIPYISEALRDILGVEPQDAMRDRSLIARCVLRADHPRLLAAMAQSIRDLQPLQCEYRVRLPDGKVRWHLTSAMPVAESDGSVLLHGYTQDITERKHAQQQIEHLAFYDALTSLPNRRLLLDRLERAVRVSQRSHQYGALLFIDLDNFKDLNDTLGHDMGDQLLVHVAARLSSAVRECDTVARFGGDEFVVMLEGLGTLAQEANRQAEAVARKLLSCLNQSFDLAGQRHYSTPSIGLTLFGPERLGVDELLKRADLAMYQAKAAGRNTCRLFNAGMQAALHARSSLEADLRQCLVGGELFVHYQPVVDHQGKILGTEVLARWKHPERGLVSPVEFIPIAEQTGLILALGRQVLQMACMQLACWGRRSDTAHLSVAVNVSYRQFRQPGFVAEVLQILRETGANPQRLRFDFTESMTLGDAEGAIARMYQLKEAGVGFALDDFGTGYSSMGHLKRLPLDQLKIDRSFVRDVLSDPNDAAIVRTILALAHSMDMEVVAEGVETVGQQAYLRLHGCTQFQGYLFGRPGPVENVEALLCEKR